MITVEDYFRGYAVSGRDWHANEITDQHRQSAAALLERVNQLLSYAAAADVQMPTNPKTGSCVSGEHDGGWRPRDCPIGAPNSAHKTGEAVDVYDPHGDLDDWLTDLSLQKFGLYREHPASTRGWCHLTTRAPRSRSRTFYP